MGLTHGTQSNRVLRRYKNNQDCFLRVNFTDEERLEFRFEREVDGQEFVERRVGRILKVRC
jgi:RNA-dependent RNA polymerase